MISGSSRHPEERETFEMGPKAKVEQVNLNAEELAKRTHTCGELKAKDVGKAVTLEGWVHRRRDHGGVIFIDLRDRYGLTQVVFRPGGSADLQDRARRLRNEYVINVQGIIRHRPEDMVNPNMVTGEVELEAQQVTLLSESKSPPFLIDEESGALEELRLKYRYLDLRRLPLQRALQLRHEVYQAIRKYLNQKLFLEIDTPILTKSTPEGARDYLVPSRTYRGKFYALPQSPQIYKQLLMLAGLDRYYQIARCFRDEDPRADRQPEFTQIDIEMSFVDEEEIYTLTEGLFKHVFAEVLDVSLKIPFLRLDYWNALSRYGTDKPDIRFGLELVDLNDLFSESHFQVFSKVLEGGGQIKGINASGCGSYSRKEMNQLAEIAKSFGAPGLIFFKVASEEDAEGGLQSSMAKFLSPEEMTRLRERMKAQEGDLLLIVAGEQRAVAESLGQLRLEVAQRQKLIEPGQFQFCWVCNFPLFNRNPETGRVESEHHPFTGFREEDIDFFKTDPTKIRSRAYDIVLNGVELGSGSIRIHRKDHQKKVFEVLGLSQDQIQRRFGFLLEAFDYGAPPHGGIAPGLDRLIMIMSGLGSIRDVIAFPKTTTGASLMSGAPATVDESQLEDLGIALRPRKRDRDVGA
jgi:aspartyl-tRNA synthetase